MSESGRPIGAHTASVANIVVEGIGPRALADVVSQGVDHVGDPVVPSSMGTAPVRCCLADTRPGDEAAVIAWSPYRWLEPYRQTGPIVVHT